MRMGASDWRDRRAASGKTPMPQSGAKWRSELSHKVSLSFDERTTRNAGAAYSEHRDNGLVTMFS